jgi:hypothetical protein
MTNPELSGGYQLSVLTAIMTRYSPQSAAQEDFLAARNKLLSDATAVSMNDVRVVNEVRDYWSNVAAGKNMRYDAKGERAPLKQMPRSLSPAGSE